MDKTRDIVDELFLTGATGSNDARSKNLSEGDDVDDDGCRIMVEHLRDAGKKINPKKAVGVHGIRGTAIRRPNGNTWTWLNRKRRTRSYPMR